MPNVLFVQWGRRRGAIAATMGLVAWSLAASGAWASRDIDPQVHQPHASVAPRATTSPTGLTPSQVKQAYGFSSSSSAGSGQRVAIVAPFHHPNIEKDLNAFSKAFGLPACTSATGCFKRVDSSGGKVWPATNATWSIEVALDVEWVHAIAPGARILLVEAKSDRLSDVLKAHDFATTKAKYVSNSWGLAEFSGQSKHDYHFKRPGVSIFVASGDDGAGQGPSYPATAPGAIAVGGTRLSGIGTSSFTETGWTGSGGGCSQYSAAPAAQVAYPGYLATGCAGKRAAPDVALVADPRSGVSVYNSYQTTAPWTTLGGTSASAPMWAARAAVSGLVITPDLLYSIPSVIPFRDVTSGNNGLPAGAGFDLVTGLGSWTGR